jgi:hypothetical protein
MAKNISLLGADYPDVPAVQLPRTGGGTALFLDGSDFLQAVATGSVSANSSSDITTPLEAGSVYLILCSGSSESRMGILLASIRSAGNSIIGEAYKGNDLTVTGIIGGIRIANSSNYAVHYSIVIF